MEISLENLYVDIGTWRVNKASKHHNKIIQSNSIEAGGEHNYVTGET